VSAMQRQVEVGEVMGTVVSLDARTPDAALAADGFARVMAWLREADARFSTYRDDSDVRRLDRGELRLEEAHPDVRTVLDRCERLRVQTGGAFDVRVTGRLDPSALVKGWAVQCGADLLQAHGLTDFMLAAGGDVVVRGGARPAPTWQVGVQHPRDRGAVATTFAATDCAIATSGTYERGAHLIDPRSGSAPVGVLSVTVVGDDLGLADAYSTAAFALGPDGPAWTLTLDGYEALTILADDRVLRTPGFPGAAPSDLARRT
jgi:FAD:protein FMN transferase